MALFAIADLHLSLNDNKSMDVFRGWENYVEKIEKNWRLLVKPDDTVVIAGDVSWAMSLSGLVKDFTFIEALPGRKLIIKGNHDYWWETMSKMNTFLECNNFLSIKFIHNSAEPCGNVCVCGTRGWFFDGGEDKKILLREAGRLETSIAAAEKSGLEPVVFLHYPPVCCGNACGEIVDVMKRHNIKRCYYGHLHGHATANATQGEFNGITYRLISSDYLKFVPLKV